MTVKSKETWITEIEEHIARLKKQGHHHYFGFSLMMTATAASVIKKHFVGQGYVVEFSRCPRGYFDFIIEWA